MSQVMLLPIHANGARSYCTMLKVETGSWMLFGGVPNSLHVAWTRHTDKLTERKGCGSRV